MVNKLRISLLSITILLVVSVSVGVVAAANSYSSQITSEFLLDSTGQWTKCQEDLGVTYEIKGTPGAVGSVTTSAYAGNPQASAVIPEGISLTNFRIVTFDVDASKFESAKITFSYSDSDVQNIAAPYAIYKYLDASNSYVKLPTTVDTEAKTLTISLSNAADPLFAIGGASVANNGDGTTTWIIIAVLAIVLVIVAVILVVRLKNAGKLNSYQVLN